jgi:hypothetical protein
MIAKSTGARRPRRAASNASGGKPSAAKVLTHAIDRSTSSLSVWRQGTIDWLYEALETLKSPFPIDARLRIELVEVLEWYYLELSCREIDSKPGRRHAESLWRAALLALELLNHGAKSNKAAVIAALPITASAAVRDNVLRKLSDAKRGRAPFVRSFDRETVEAAVKRLR